MSGEPAPLGSLRSSPGVTSLQAGLPGRKGAEEGEAGGGGGG